MRIPKIFLQHSKILITFRCDLQADNSSIIQYLSSSMNKEKHTQLIKHKARELGFMYCGISKADFLKEEAPRLEEWLKKEHHGEMSYMTNHFDKRLDPRILVEGAKTVVSLLLNYYPDTKQSDEEAPKISCS